MCCCGDTILLVYKFMKLLFQSGLNLKNKVDKEPHLLFLHLAVWEIYDAACLKHIISPSVSNCLTSMKEENDYETTCANEHELVASSVMMRDT